MPPSDRDYFRARADEERWLASQSTAPNIRAIHLELAAKYDELVGLHAADLEGRAADDGPWDQAPIMTPVPREEIDPEDPVLQNGVAERLVAEAARVRRQLEQ